MSLVIHFEMSYEDRECAAGGQVLAEPLTIPGVGEYVPFMDTEGNRLSMLQPNA